MKKVLILGAGLVARPIIEYLLENGFRIIVASPMKERADEMIAGNHEGRSIFWTMEDEATLNRLVAENDVTVSLLPYKFHAGVAKVCLKHRRPLVTTSYVQTEMQAMDNEVRKAGVIFLNEIGLDPGIDHMSAMKIIDSIHNKGGKVEEFYSICGALPAPEAADNPLRYKFSWSPKGVVMASRNSALYLKNGKRIFIEPANLFRDVFEADFPGVPECRTIYRGTFRFKGWCETLDLMKSINMLDDDDRDYSGMTYAGFIGERAGVKTKEVRMELCNKTGLLKESVPITALEWLGFFDDSDMGYNITSPFEITSDLMIRKMPLGDNERDMVVLQHTFQASYPDGKKEKIISSMLDFGTPATNTSIARTVALPAAIAVKLILEGKIILSGVYRPVVPEIYEPVLAGLEKMNIKMREEYI
jgi:saccharopine dehydrogenase-like NADP-dependent oxidoreductase